MVNIDHIRAVIASHATLPSSQAKAFFKTGSGHYAEGDEFIGVTYQICARLLKISLILLSPLESLLSSKINEERLLALLI
ncbi:MAG: hypothetical protein MRQ07_03435 [Candidatus Midichloria sp.]|nr:hypothetical protein [Candidatus Midichloria sp.]